MLGLIRKGRRNLRNVYPTSTGNVYLFFLYYIIFFNKVDVVDVKYTIHGECHGHDLSIGGIMRSNVYHSNHAGNSANFGRHKKRLPGGSQ